MQQAADQSAMHPPSYYIITENKSPTSLPAVLDIGSPIANISSAAGSHAENGRGQHWATLGNTSAPLAARKLQQGNSTNPSRGACSAAVVEVYLTSLVDIFHWCEAKCEAKEDKSDRFAGEKG